MSVNKGENKSDSELSEVMLVIINQDWERIYTASINTVQQKNSDDLLSAKCELKNDSIISNATDKNTLSENMCELATIIEDRISKETPQGTPVIAGMNFILN